MSVRAPYTESVARRACAPIVVRVIRVDAATVLLQWSVGGLAFCWFTTRRRVVGIGYGWLLRGVYLLMALGAFGCGLAFGFEPVRDGASIAVALAALAALGSSVVRRRAQMTGRPEFDPRLDLIAPLLGVVGLVAAGIGAGGNDLVAVIRTVVGAVFLGAVTDAMLLGHWYLVQPGLPRSLLNELVQVTLYVLPVEVVALLLPTGMFSVFSGSVNDGWNGTLGYFWVASAVTTGVLCVITKRALKERYYSAVMAATGLLYLAILTAFGTDIVARAVLAG